jgi:hypothetical protein
MTVKGDSIVKHIVLMSLGILVAGCSSLVPATVVRLAALSPMNADPGQFEVALDLPDGVGIVPGSAVLSFEARERPDAPPQVGAVVLQRLERMPPVWRIHPSDLEDMRAFQAQALAWEMADPVAASGSLSVYLEPCRSGGGPAPDARLSILLRTEVDGPFRPLVRDARLRDFAEDGAIASLPECPRLGSNL